MLVSFFFVYVHSFRLKYKIMFIDIKYTLYIVFFRKRNIIILLIIISQNIYANINVLWQLILLAIRA